MNIANASQGGLSLPNRDYYTKTDEKSVKLGRLCQSCCCDVRAARRQHEVGLTNARTIIAIETKLAQNSREPAELRDPTTQYHVMGPEELGKLIPTFHGKIIWQRLYAGWPSDECRTPRVFPGRGQDADRNPTCRLEDLFALERSQFRKLVIIFEV